MGVLIGALVTSGITYLGDRNARNAEKRAAVRLVTIEVRTDTILLSVFDQYGRLAPDLQPQAIAWRENQATLARHLSRGRWEDVAHFYSDLASFGLFDGRCSDREFRNNARVVVRNGINLVHELGDHEFSIAAYKRRPCP